MQDLANLIKSLMVCSAALDQFVAAQPDNARNRRNTLDELKSEKNERAIEDLKKEISYDVQGAMEVEKALAHLEGSKKNAEGALQKLAAQARKDLETITTGSNESANAAIKLRSLCQDLANSLLPVAQKIKFPQLDAKNLMSQLQTDRSVQSRGVAQDLHRSFDNIEETLTAMSQNLAQLAESVRVFKP